jgi:hypothetical protein
MDFADTSGITSGGGEYRNTPSLSIFTANDFALTADLSDPLVIENTASPGYIGFAESVAPFNDESLTNSFFETYALNTARFGASGGLSVAAATFPTSAGDLNFTTITFLGFEALTIPEPSSVILLPTMLLVSALFARKRIVKQRR